MNHYDCEKHRWTGVGIELCPSCSAERTTKKPLTAKQKIRLSKTAAPRIDDISGGAWAKIRNRIRERDSYHCRMCGRPEANGVVDHIKPLELGGTNDDDNLQYLCKPCHVDKTNRDRGFKVKKPVGLDGMPSDPNHHWNK